MFQVDVSDRLGFQLSLSVPTRGAMRVGCVRWDGSRNIRPRTCGRASEAMWSGSSNTRPVRESVLGRPDQLEDGLDVDDD